MIVVVMGVSGSGKTTIGKRLAARLGCEFIEGDDFHPPANVAKMASGTPLDDQDRLPWLLVLNQELQRRKSAVLACSALKQAYRNLLLQGVSGSCLVFLKGSKELLEERLQSRKHRYMPASLLESQFAALEPPRHAIEVDVREELEECVDSIAARLSVRSD
jgi:carbohydrate kinase (thermoresistant glucokinase family)